MALVLAISLGAFALFCLSVCYCALRAHAASERLARRAELELATRTNAAVADESATARTVSDREPEASVGGYHFNLFI